MKRFCIKFCLLFLLIDGFVGLYHFGIRPNLTGDMGQIGQIPFGQEYNERMLATCSHDRKRVQEIFPQDSITAPLLTIGDSFSKLGERGYSQFLSELLQCDAQNVNYAYESSPTQVLVELINQDKIPDSTTVVLEVVERCFIWWMYYINLQDTAAAYYAEEVVAEPQPDNPRYLENALLFLKKAAGIKQSITCYPTSQDLFSHQKKHNKLYIYDSPWDKDGDLRFTELSEEEIVRAYQNMEALHELAERHGVKLVVLIAADKYDVYEPFIITDHPINQTLDYCPEVPWIINTKPLLQAQAYAGVKDLYYINDTHWTPAGARIVADEVFRRLQDL